MGAHARKHLSLFRSVPSSHPTVPTTVLKQVSELTSQNVHSASRSLLKQPTSGGCVPQPLE